MERLGIIIPRSSDPLGTEHFLLGRVSNVAEIARQVAMKVVRMRGTFQMAFEIKGRVVISYRGLL